MRRLAGRIQTPLDSSPQPIRTLSGAIQSPILQADPGQIYELQCYCGIGSPDNVCGREINWMVTHIGLIYDDVGCEGPCDPQSLDCEEDKQNVGSGYTFKWCACQ